MADVNPTGFNELEEKKWIISRIDLYQKTLIEAFQTDVQKQENNHREAISQMKSRRNYVLSFLGIVLTTLLGINPFYHIEQWIFFIFLMILGVSGLITVIVTNRFCRIIDYIFTKTIEVLNDSIGDLVEAHSYMINRALILSNITIQYALNYFYFVHSLSGAIMIRLAERLIQLTKDFKNSPDIKRKFREEAKTYTKNLEQFKIHYQHLDRSHDLPLELLEFVDENMGDKFAKYVPKGNTKNQK